MLRAFLCTAALASLATVSFAADAKDAKDTKADNGQAATVTKVDAQKNTLTVMMKDKDGKEEQQTFDLTKDVKLQDAAGKTIEASSLQKGDAIRIVEQNGKLAEVRRENSHSGETGQAHNGKKGEEATITNVDAKKGTVTVKMKDKEGKDVERTFTLAEDAQYMDSNGRVAELDVFRSGNEVLVVEEQGKLKQMQQKANEKKPEEKKPEEKSK